MSLWSRLLGIPALGYKPCGRDSRDLPCSVLLERIGAASGTIAESIDLWRGYEPFDQKDTNSCAGCSVAQGLRLAFAEDGRYVPPLSPLFLYYNARRDEAPAATGVVDDGTTFRSVMRALGRLGVCPESRWPLQSSAENSRPSWLAYRDAADYRGLRGYYRCFSIDDIKRALSARRPVVIGLSIDKDFTKTSGPAYVEDTPGGAGGHGMLLTGYDKQGRFHLVNSWGARWRGGKILVGEAFVRRNQSAWALDT